MDAKPIPEWRRRRLARLPVYADWWRRRHHCSDAVLGESRAPAASSPAAPTDQATSRNGRYEPN